MDDLKALSTEDLVDLLSEQTAIYYKMVKSNRRTEQLHICRDLILELHLEIECRKGVEKAIEKPLAPDSDTLQGANPA